LATFAAEVAALLVEWGLNMDVSKPAAVITCLNHLEIVSFDAGPLGVT